MDARADLTLRRIRILARICLFWGVLILARLIYLQIIHHDDYVRQAQAQQEREIEIQAPRGTLFDRTGQPLAMSVQVDSVCINPLRVPDIDIAANLLAQTLSMDARDLRDRMKAAVDNRRGFLWIKRKITPEESAKLRNFRLDWIEFRPDSRRFYPSGQVASHVIGAVDHEEKGNGGLELALNKDLQGKPGYVRTTSDVKQRVVDLKVMGDPQPGKNVTLSIDARIQYVAEKELAAAVTENHCKTGTVVVMNPNTGEVYAMASYPTFNPNEPLKDKEDQKARLNLAVSAPFEPGSVFKIITLSAALETTRLKPESQFFCGNGSMTLFKRVIHDAHPYGTLTMADVLKKSSNIGAIKIGLEVGNERMYEFIKKFGFGKPTGIGLPSESGGRVWRLERWIPSSIGSVAMGHEVTVTSVQLAQAASVIANGGMLVHPRLTMKRQRPGNTPDPQDPDQPIVRVLKPETAITMRRMMERVVEKGGTGTRAAVDGYSVGGKTGSAQMYDPVAHVYTHHYNASFVGFAPVNNPAIVVAVTITDSKQWGGTVAGPVFSKVAQAALRILDVPKDRPEGLKKQSQIDDDTDDDVASPELVARNPYEDEDEKPPTILAGVGALSRTAAAAEPAVPTEEKFIGPPVTQNEVVVAGPKTPNFRGKTLRQVVQQSASSGVPIEIVGSGLVRDQSPAAGTPLRQGEKVRLELAR